MKSYLKPALIYFGVISLRGHGTVIVRWKLYLSEENRTIQPLTKPTKCLRGSRKFCPNFTTFFSWWEDPNTTICGPSSGRQRNAISMALRWIGNDGQTLNAGLVALWFFRGSGPVLLGNNICLCFFREGVRPPVPLSGSAHEMAAEPSSDELGHAPRPIRAFIVSLGALLFSV